MACWAGKACPFSCRRGDQVVGPFWIIHSSVSSSQNTKNGSTDMWTWNLANKWTKLFAEQGCRCRSESKSTPPPKAQYIYLDQISSLATLFPIFWLGHFSSTLLTPVFKKPVKLMVFNIHIHQLLQCLGFMSQGLELSRGFCFEVFSLKDPRETQQKLPSRLKIHLVYPRNPTNPTEMKLREYCIMHASDFNNISVGRVKVPFKVENNLSFQSQNQQFKPVPARILRNVMRAEETKLNDRSLVGVSFWLNDNPLSTRI